MIHSWPLTLIVSSSQPVLITKLSQKKMVMSFLMWKGYPHSMIIFAYFRMKFSSLKMNNDREEEPPVPGRLMSAAFLAKWRSEPSEGPQYSPPSWPSWPPTVKFAILQKKNSSLRIKVIFTVSKLLCRLMFKKHWYSYCCYNNTGRSHYCFCWYYI